jgi:hypothetical protein
MSRDCAEFIQAGVGEFAQDVQVDRIVTDGSVASDRFAAITN